MKANVLRIGNLISHANCNFFRVDEIRPTSRGYIARMYPFLGSDSPNQFDSWLDLPLKDAKPIQLTAELIKSIHKDVTSYATQTLLFFTDRFRLKWLPEYHYWYVTDRKTGTYVTKVEFVHEWQNVFFAMNGEELEVKLPTE